MQSFVHRNNHAYSVYVFSVFLALCSRVVGRFFVSCYESELGKTELSHLSSYFLGDSAAICVANVDAVGQVARALAQRYLAEFAVHGPRPHDQLRGLGQRGALVRARLRVVYPNPLSNIFYFSQFGRISSSSGL